MLNVKLKVFTFFSKVCTTHIHTVRFILTVILSHTLLCFYVQLWFKKKKSHISGSVMSLYIMWLAFVVYEKKKSLRKQWMKPKERNAFMGALEPWRTFTLKVKRPLKNLLAWKSGSGAWEPFFYFFLPSNCLRKLFFSHVESRGSVTELA